MLNKDQALLLYFQGLLHMLAMEKMSLKEKIQILQIVN